MTASWLSTKKRQTHYIDVIMSTMASQITSLTIVYSIIYSGADQRKHQSSASLAFVRGIHRWPVNSPRKEPVTRKMFPLDDVTMQNITEGSTVVASKPSFSVPVHCNDRHKTWAWTQREFLQFGVKSCEFCPESFIYLVIMSYWKMMTISGYKFSCANVCHDSIINN